MHSIEEITLKIVDMQVQGGTCDCGLFTIAYLAGARPESCTFMQTEIRKHLYDYFKCERISLLPLLKQRRAGSLKKNVDTVPVYCICRMPECCSIDMIECCNCSEWYHVTCVPLVAEALENPDLFASIVISCQYILCIV